MSWVDRAAQCAEGMLEGPLKGVVPVRSASGKGIPHLCWMAYQLAHKHVGSETKTCRWLGYLQAGLIAADLSTLETEKQRNKSSGSSIRECAQLLLEALDSTCWSSWQTTGSFSAEMESLRAALSKDVQ